MSLLSPSLAFLPHLCPYQNAFLETMSIFVDSSMILSLKCCTKNRVKNSLLTATNSESFWFGTGVLGVFFVVVWFGFYLFIY